MAFADASAQQYKFSPQVIPGLSLWLDGQDSTSMTFNGAGLVTAWTDKSIYSTNNATANTPITLDPDGLGTGYQALTFTGSEWLTGAVSITGTTYTAFVVASMNTTSAASARLLALSAPNTTDSTSASHITLARTGTSTTVQNKRNATVASTTITYATPTLFTTSADNTNIYISQNGGVSVGTGSSGAFTISSYAIGNNTLTTDVTGPLNGFVGEVIVYNCYLSTTQQAQVQGYLAWKWGLQTSLPTTSSYTDNPPYVRLFQPTDITGCLAWWDCADWSQIQGTLSNVTGLSDKSGNGNTMTTQSGTITTTTYNGKLCLNFPASIAYMRTSTYFTISQNNITLFLVCQNPTTFNTVYNEPFTGYDLNGGYGFGNGDGGIRITSSGLNTSGDLNWGNGNFVINGTTAASNPQSLQSGMNIIYAPFNQNTGGSSRLSISTNYAFGGITRCFIGAIGEVIIYSSPPTTQQRQQIEGYLAWKWGIPKYLPTTAPGYQLPSYTTKFIPTQISNCLVWFDAADGSTYNLTNITSWTNKGTGGGTATNVSTAPTLSKINAGHAINFSGTTGMRFTTSWSSSVRSFFVVSLPGANTNNYGYLNQYGGGNFQFSAWNAGGFGPFLANNGTGIYVAGTSVANFYNTPNLFCALGNGSGGQTSSTGIFINGNSTSLITGNVASLGTGTITTYIGWDTVQTSTGIPIGEILVYDVLLTIVQRQQIEGYLAWKWGLAGKLPITHPYKTFQP
jgi:hypothetical protein